jgi:ferrous iron transport protein B
VYGVGDVKDNAKPLSEKLRTATWDSGPRAGQLIYTLPAAVALLVFYVIALQCASTVAVVKRETNSWRWPIFMWSYMAVLAYGFAWIAYRLTALFT